MTFFIEGQDAHAIGMSIQDCPYKKLTFGFSEWIRGFLSAQLEAY